MGSAEITKERIRNYVHGAGDQFVDDIKAIYDTYEEDFLYSESLINLVSNSNPCAVNSVFSTVFTNKLGDFNYFNPNGIFSLSAGMVE